MGLSKETLVFFLLKGFVSKKLCRSQRQEESKKHHHSYGPHIFFALFETAVAYCSVSTKTKIVQHYHLKWYLLLMYTYILTFSVVSRHRIHLISLTVPVSLMVPFPAVAKRHIFNSPVCTGIKLATSGTSIHQNRRQVGTQVFYKIVLRPCQWLVGRWTEPNWRAIRYVVTYNELAYPMRPWSHQRSGSMIRIRIRGSVPLDYESGFCYFFSDFQDANEK
jgi:hypothetical protein